MALTLGTNTYIELASFKSWCDTFGKDYTSFSDQTIEAMCAETSVYYIDTNYTFKGSKIDDDQSMQLPTDEVSIADIENATALAVWYNLNGWLLVDPSTRSANGQVTLERKKLDVMEKETEYAERSQSSYRFNTQAVDNAFKPFAVVCGQATSFRVL